MSCLTFKVTPSCDLELEAKPTYDFKFTASLVCSVGPFDTDFVVITRNGFALTFDRTVVGFAQNNE